MTPVWALSRERAVRTGQLNHGQEEGRREGGACRARGHGHRERENMACASPTSLTVPPAPPSGADRRCIRCTPPLLRDHPPDRCPAAQSTPRLGLERAVGAEGRACVAASVVWRSARIVNLGPNALCNPSIGGRGCASARHFAVLASVSRTHPLDSMWRLRRGTQPPTSF